MSGYIDLPNSMRLFEGRRRPRAEITARGRRSKTFRFGSTSFTTGNRHRRTTRPRQSKRQLPGPHVIESRQGRRSRRSIHSPSYLPLTIERKWPVRTTCALCTCCALLLTGRPSRPCLNVRRGRRLKGQLSSQWLISDCIDVVMHTKTVEVKYNAVLNL